MDLLEVYDTIKACIVSRKGGMPINIISKDYEKLTGSSIPYLAIGFTSLYDMLRNMPNLFTKRNENNEVVYVIKNDKKIAHINELVQKQKDPRIINNKEKQVISNKVYYPQVNVPKSGKYEKRNSHVVLSRKQSNTKTIVNKNHDFFFNSEVEHSLHASQESTTHQEHKSVVVRNITAEEHFNMQKPMVNSTELIGDDFFLQLAIRNLGNAVWRYRQNGPLHCGLCVSGQTINACRESLKFVQSLGKIVIMLGAEDIYKGRTVHQMSDDYKDLLIFIMGSYGLKRSDVTLCTLPPLVNLTSINAGQSGKKNVLLDFNSWLVNFSVKSGFGLIDFFAHLTSVKQIPQYEFYQLDARWVSGTPHPYVLFNRRGRRLAMSLLRGFSNSC